MKKNRNIYKYIKNDLKEKMVFIGGPRQVGKTTLAKQIGENEYKKYTYLNWDNYEDKRLILNSKVDPESALIIYDEIHKYSRWKNHIKGEMKSRLLELKTSKIFLLSIIHS